MQFYQTNQGLFWVGPQKENNEHHLAEKSNNIDLTDTNYKSHTVKIYQDLSYISLYIDI